MAGPFFLFILVTLLHYYSLCIEARFHWYSRHFGKAGFWIHFVITGALWFWVTLVFMVPPASATAPLPFSFPFMKLVGQAITLIGLLIALWAIILLGIPRMWGVRYFKSSRDDVIEHRGIYRVLKNPIYDGFFLIFLGSALSSNSLFYLYGALESFILLNCLLARFENKDITLYNPSI